MKQQKQIIVIAVCVILTIIGLVYQIQAVSGAEQGVKFWQQEK